MLTTGPDPEAGWSYW